MDFVTYHLKQVGLDTKLLNGGVILTGGGSQLKHLIQLTEYVTGLNARIGLPNEHLQGGHIDELAKPMYSTCIGLILKGYNDYENKNRQLEPNFIEVKVPAALQKQQTATTEPVEVETDNQTEPVKELKVKQRKSLKGLMDSMKSGLIDLFKEEGDTQL
jgi:cell division protein FtsA